MTAGAGAGAAGTAVISTTPPPAARTGGAPPSVPRSSPNGSTGGREVLPLWLRVVAWVVALPLGLLIVGIPARQAGYLSSQKLLDVIVKRDLGRFVPLLVIVALWALVSALLVTLFIEGGRRFRQRRRNRPTSRAGAPLVTPDGAIAAPGPPPPPRQRRAGSRDRGGS
jgi:hypothetical protein